MHSPRFPEDHVQDNMETGQLSSWHTMGLSVPDTNIFLDHQIFNKLKENPEYVYDEVSRYFLNYSSVQSSLSKIGYGGHRERFGICGEVRATYKARGT